MPYRDAQLRAGGTAPVRPARPGGASGPAPAPNRAALSRAGAGPEGGRPPW